ncbi:MAG TPA: PAS domain-containing sensor histidine kinase [Rhizomicrobium sp.]|jgi:two-component system nitrogen regulation sensor histidine kinase NtrY
MALSDAIKAPPQGGMPSGFRGISRPSLLAFGVGVLAIVSVVASYCIVIGVVPYRLSRPGMMVLLLINFGLAMTLGGLVAWRVVRLWSERRSGAGARLHVRLVGMFAAIAVVPAIFVAVFAVVSLNLGMDQWFNPQVQGAIYNSADIADRYGKERTGLLGEDIASIVNGVQADPQLVGADSQINLVQLFKDLHTLVEARQLHAAFVFDHNGTQIGATYATLEKDQNANGTQATKTQKPYDTTRRPTPDNIAVADTGGVVFDADYDHSVERAMMKFPGFNGYLMVVRKVDPTVFQMFRKAARVKHAYEAMDRDRARTQLAFAELYGVISLLVLLVAIWLGLWAANRLVKPISYLIDAAERVTAGDLRAQVAVERDDDEVGVLGRAFNRMTTQLQTQRTELVEASHQIDMRRRFTEAVLAGVSAGVIGLDGDGRITIVNRAAARLLNAAHEEIEGRHYSEAVPELAPLIRKALGEPIGRASGEASVKRAGKVRNLSVQVDSEEGGREVGYIVTFDDITDLVSAQRTAAWADVARRIAHEIKNPLTPIQLSAERLKRKYAKEITTDPDVFSQCTDTIIRQVGDIGRMVDEFSSFARMPTPIMRRENAQELVHQGVFLQREAHPEILFEIKAPAEPIYFESDGRLVSQALTNVLKNAGESVAARVAEDKEPRGHIVASLEVLDADRFAFRVTDNGLGLPAEHRHRLTEPYVTTRAKGTGLGLAIVRKIAEDHGGEITLADRGDEESGAVISLIFPLRQKPVRDASKDKKGIGDEQERIVDRA